MHLLSSSCLRALTVHVTVRALLRKRVGLPDVLRRLSLNLLELIGQEIHLELRLCPAGVPATWQGGEGERAVERGLWGEGCGEAHGR